MVVVEKSGSDEGVLVYKTEETNNKYEIDDIVERNIEYREGSI